METEQSANIDTQLQHRMDLIPNLVKTVKSFTEHETEGYLTEADGEVPQMIVEENEDPLPVVILYAFFCFWIVFIIPFIIFLLVWKFGWHNDFEDLGDMSSWSSAFSRGGTGGGDSYSGGGGSFGGGGASR